MGCQASLCRGCDTVHGKWKEFRQHTTVTIEEYLCHPKDYTIEQQTRLLKIVVFSYINYACVESGVRLVVYHKCIL